MSLEEHGLLRDVVMHLSMTDKKKKKKIPHECQLMLTLNELHWSAIKISYNLRCLQLSNYINSRKTMVDYPV